MDRRARHTCLLGVVAIPALAVAAAPTPEASLTACLGRLDGLDLGYERIAERCPELTAALAASDIAPWLPADWTRPGNELSAAGLTQLKVLIEHERAARLAPGGPDPATLAPILRQLTDVTPAAGRRARLAAWLRERLGPSPNPARAAWLARLLAGLREPAAPPLPVILAPLVLAAGAALILTWRHRRRLGRWLRRWQPLRHPRPHASAALPDGAPPASPLGAAPLAEQPGLLLQSLTALLAAQGRVPGAQGLTARELTEAAHLPLPDRARFATLAQVAEVLRYAQAPPPIAQIVSAVEQGRQLLAHLAPKVRS